MESVHAIPIPPAKGCVVAAVDNVAKFDQLEVDRSDRFCGSVGESLRGACYKQIGLNLRRRMTSSEAAEDRCDDVARAGINSCVAGVHGRVAAAPFTRAKPTKPKTKTTAKQSKPAVIGAVVAMDDGGPYPKRVTIKRGQAVNFVNRGQNDWWPASDPHPIHTDYEGFDAGPSHRAGALVDISLRPAGDVDVPQPPLADAERDRRRQVGRRC